MSLSDQKHTFLDFMYVLHMEPKGHVPNEKDKDIYPLQVSLKAFRDLHLPLSKRDLFSERGEVS